MSATQAPLGGLPGNPGILAMVAGVGLPAPRKPHFEVLARVFAVGVTRRWRTYGTSLGYEAALIIRKLWSATPGSIPALTRIRVAETLYGVRWTNTS